VAVAAGVALGASRALAFGGMAGLAPAARVGGAAAGSVDAGVGRGRGAASTSTFGRTGRGDGAGRDGRVGRIEVVRPDGRLAAADVRERLENGASGTYIAELLLRRDSSLIRWPDRPDRPLAVFVADGASLVDWRPEYVSAVASALAAWTRAGVPLDFRLVDDSARADVRVAWIDRFTQPISGRTVWSRDDRWWLVDGTVTLALHHSDGAPLDADQMRALALHEVGHLIGLDHTGDPDNVMAPRVRVRELSAADAATARLLYSVPAGRVR
jgi:hypothetical protein